MSKAYRVYNLRMNSIKESIYVKFNEFLEAKRNNKDEKEISIDPSKRIENIVIKLMSQLVRVYES